MTTPDGWPIWTSGVRPGRDTTAVHAHPEVLPLLSEWPDEVHAVLGDLGCEDEQAALTTRIKESADDPCPTISARQPAARGYPGAH